jgi:hypothetical protein
MVDGVTSTMVVKASHGEGDISYSVGAREQHSMRN